MRAWYDAIFADAVYVIRYGHQDLDRILTRWPCRKVRKVAAALGRIIQAENGKKPTGDASDDAAW